LRFPEFEGEWKEKKLGEICKFVRGPFGSALKKEFFINDGYAVYEQSHAIHNNFNSFRYYISEEKFNGLRRFSVEPKDIIMSCSGTMGKFAIIPEKSKKGVINQALLKLTSKENFNHKYIKIALELPQTQNKLLSQSAGGAIKNVVGIPQLKEIGLYIPKLIEQDKISTFFSLLDQRIETQSKIIEKYESLIKGLSDLLYSQNIRFKYKNGCEFPIWQIKSLEVIGKTFNGLSGKTKEDFSTGKPYIQYKQVFDSPKIQIQNCGLVEISKNESQNRVKFGDVFFTISSETPDEIGMSSVLLDEVDEIYLNSFCFGYRPFSFGILSPLFASYLFRNSSFRKKIVKIAQGSTRYNISKDELMKIEISLPNVDEQIIIASFLSAIDEKIKLEKQILKLYTKQKNSLLQNLFI
jgi:type I restriction enzyme S subunit